MTEEERRRLAEAESLEELDRLLQSYIDAGIITMAEAADLADSYGIEIEASTTQIPRIGARFFGDLAAYHQATSGASAKVTPLFQMPQETPDLAKLLGIESKLLPKSGTPTTTTLPPLSIGTTTGVPPLSTPTTTAPAPPTTGTTTVAPLPSGVTLTGNRKFIGENEYEQGSDGRWYQLAPPPTAPPPTGPTVAPLPAEVQDYLYGYTSPKDLADRLASLINQGYLDEGQAAKLYNEMLGETSAALNAALEYLAYARDMGWSEEELAYYEKAVADEQAKLDNKAMMFIRAGMETVQEELEVQKQAELEAPAIKAQIQALKNSYLPTLRTYLDDAVKAGNTTQEQADATYNYEESLIEAGYPLKNLPNYQQVSGIIASTPTAIETAQVLADEQNRLAQEKALEALYGPKKTPEEEAIERAARWEADFERKKEAMRLAAIPEAPTYASVYEPFLAGIGAPTFRQFVESKLGRIAEETEGARADWWKRMHAPPPERPFGAVEGESYADLVARLRGEGGRLGELLLGKGIAPTMGGPPTAEGPGYVLQKKQNELNALLAELYGMGEPGFQDYMRSQIGAPAKEEDPFAKALKAYPFMEQFMQLGPQERGYTKARFAPRVQYRF